MPDDKPPQIDGTFSVSQPAKWVPGEKMFDPGSLVPGDVMTVEMRVVIITATPEQKAMVYDLQRAWNALCKTSLSHV